MASPALYEDDQEVIAVPTTKSARIKGTWTMFWGLKEFDFVDGQRYTIPNDLYAYLLKNHCIYDTL